MDTIRRILSNPTLIMNWLISQIQIQKLTLEGIEFISKIKGKMLSRKSPDIICIGSKEKKPTSPPVQQRPQPEEITDTSLVTAASLVLLNPFLAEDIFRHVGMHKRNVFRTVCKQWNATISSCICQQMKENRCNIDEEEEIIWVPLFELPALTGNVRSIRITCDLSNHCHGPNPSEIRANIMRMKKTFFRTYLKRVGKPLTVFKLIKDALYFGSPFSLDLNHNSTTCILKSTETGGRKYCDCVPLGPEFLKRMKAGDVLSFTYFAGDGQSGLFSIENFKVQIELEPPYLQEWRLEKERKKFLKEQMELLATEQQQSKLKQLKN